MEIIKIKGLLAENEIDTKKIDAYCAYITRLKTEKNKEGRLIAYWLKEFQEEQLVDLFLQVKGDSEIYIDGETVTIGYYKGLGLKPIYDYRAYKNKVVEAYPGSVFDVQVVKAEDEFSFTKVDGRVKYNHAINNPFNVSAEIEGAYCVIKNRRGEFITFVNKADIRKMRDASKVKYIWDQWEDQMWFKSVVKRACKFHFMDLVAKIDKVDNMDYDLDMLMPKKEDVSDRRKLQLTLMSRLKELDKYDKHVSDEFRETLRAKQEAEELTDDLMINTLSEVVEKLKSYGHDVK